MRQIKRLDTSRAGHLKQIEYYDGLIDQMKQTAETQQMQIAIKAVHANTKGVIGEDAVDDMHTLVDDMKEQKDNITEMMELMTGSVISSSDAVTDEDFARFLPEMAMVGGGAATAAAAAPYVPSAAAAAAQVGSAAHHAPVPVLSKEDEDMLKAYA